MLRRDLLKTAAIGGTALACGGWSAPWRAAPPRQTLMIAGSTTALPTTRKLVEAFTAANPDVDVVAEGGGSQAGLIALSRGAIDLAAMSRDLKRTEYQAWLHNVLFAMDGVALVVSPANPVRALTTAQVRGILMGRITDWAEVGGPAGAIDIIHRATGSPTRRTVEEVVLGNEDIPRSLPQVGTPAEMIQRVGGNPRAAGYLRFCDFADGVVPVSVDGVPFSTRTVYSHRYAFPRSLYYVSGRQPSPAASRFLAFVRGDAGQDVVVTENLRVY